MWVIITIIISITSITIAILGVHKRQGVRELGFIVRWLMMHCTLQ